MLNKLFVFFTISSLKLWKPFLDSITLIFHFHNPFLRRRVLSGHPGIFEHFLYFEISRVPFFVFYFDFVKAAVCWRFLILNLNYVCCHHGVKAIVYTASSEILFDFTRKCKGVHKVDNVNHLVILTIKVKTFSGLFFNFIWFFVLFLTILTFDLL